MDEIFWMVWNPKGNAPTYRHPSKDAAIQEARRLAMYNPGQEFYVLRTVAKTVTPPPVIVTDLEGDFF